MEVGTEGETAGIIVGVLVVGFIFILVFFIFGTVFRKMLRSRRVASTVITGSYEVSAVDLPRTANAGELEAGGHHNMNVSSILNLATNKEKFQKILFVSCCRRMTSIMAEVIGKIPRTRTVCQMRNSQRHEPMNP